MFLTNIGYTACTMATKEQIQQWASKWPDHCPKCGGAGDFVSSYDPSPHGVALSAGCIYDFDPCTECETRNACPRCNRFRPDYDECFFEDDRPCENCGWNWGKNSDDAMPYLDEDDMTEMVDHPDWI